MRSQQVKKLPTGDFFLLTRFEVGRFYRPEVTITGGYIHEKVRNHSGRCGRFGFCQLCRCLWRLQPLRKPLLPWSDVCNGLWQQLPQARLQACLPSGLSAGSSGLQRLPLIG
jgi:hypothetical protein